MTKPTQNTRGTGVRFAARATMPVLAVPSPPTPHRTRPVNATLTQPEIPSSGVTAWGSVTDQARAMVSAVTSHAAGGGGGIVPPLEEFARLVYETVSQRDDPDAGRSWPLAPGPRGPWFEELPIEVLPRLPQDAPSPELCDRLRALADSWDGRDRFPVAEVFDTLFGAAFLRAGESDRRHALWLGFVLGLLDTRPWLRDVLYNRGASAHPDPEVRSLILSLAYVDLPWVPAERYLYAATHDTDELVFIKAFRICGRRHDERSMDHLRPIVQSPAAVLEGIRGGRMYYPVGHAACSICPAQFAILGTDEPALAQVRERELRVRLRRPLSEPVEHAREALQAAIRDFVPPPSPSVPPPDLDRMVRIPAGPFVLGLDAHEVAAEPFDWSTCTPRRTVHLPEFHIDPYPVTNAEYDGFVARLEAMPPAERRAYEHPGQPEGKPHRRNTAGDPRFGPTHPAVGIDWFDAWAYARWRGKELPNELQWEKAARGTDGRWYPWGNAFDPRALRYAGETYGAEPADLIEWIILLSRGTSEFPRATTAPVDAHPSGVSPYGVHDLCGNCWEFTRTAFFTGNDVRPAFAAFTPVELMGSREPHVVIRGGAWSSPAPLLGAAYRGYDLLTDRHTEIGFRCVWEAPDEPSSNPDEVA